MLISNQSLLFRTRTSQHTWRHTSRTDLSMRTRMSLHSTSQPPMFLDPWNFLVWWIFYWYSKFPRLSIMGSHWKKSADKKVDWQALLNSHHEGASYFTALVDILLVCPSGYFEYRHMTTRSKETVIHQWKEWMIEFSKSKVQVLHDVGAKVHHVDDDACSVLANCLVKNHKANLLQESSEQVHHVTRELTVMVHKGKAHPLWGHSLFVTCYCHECLMNV